MNIWHYIATTAALIAAAFTVTANPPAAAFAITAAALTVVAGLTKEPKP